MKEWCKGFIFLGGIQYFSGSRADISSKNGKQFWNCHEYVGLSSKLSPLLQGEHEKFLIQSCVSFDQHCREISLCWSHSWNHHTFCVILCTLLIARLIYVKLIDINQSWLMLIQSWSTLIQWCIWKYKVDMHHWINIDQPWINIDPPWLMLISFY